MHIKLEKNLEKVQLEVMEKSREIAEEEEHRPMLFIFDKNRNVHIMPLGKMWETFREFAPVILPPMLAKLNAVAYFMVLEGYGSYESALTNGLIRPSEASDRKQFLIFLAVKKGLSPEVYVAEIQETGQKRAVSKYQQIQEFDTNLVVSWEVQNDYQA